MKKWQMKYKWIGLLVVLLCVIAIIPVFYFMNQKVTYTLEKDAFWYTMNTELPLKKGTVFISEEDTIRTQPEIDVKGLPLYFYEEERIMLPKTYSLVNRDGSMYKVNRFSEIYCKDFYYYAAYGDDVITLKDCFLFDGENTYIFFDEVDMTYGKTTYTLSPLSYVTVWGDGQYEIYDPEKEFYTMGQEESKEIQVTLRKGYTIDMVNDVFYQPEKQTLLFHTPETLANKP